MSRDLNDLIPEFRAKIEELLNLCEQSGYPMRQFFTLRTPFEQGILWRQSRSAEEVQQKILELRNSGADWRTVSIVWVPKTAGMSPTPFLGFPGTSGGRQSIASGSWMETPSGQPEKR